MAMSKPAKENTVVRRLKMVLKSIPQTEVKKIHSSAYGREVDLFIVTHGLAVIIEFKALGKLSEVSPHQEARLRRWRRAGAACGSFDRIETAEAFVRKIAARGQLFQSLYESHNNKRVFTAEDANSLMLEKALDLKTQ